MKPKKQNPISQHFSEMGKKSWAKRKKELLKASKAEKPNKINN